MWKHLDGKFVFHQRAYSNNIPNSSAVNTTQTQQTTTPTTTADSGTFVDADNLPANGDVAVGVAQSGRVVYSGVVQAYVVDMDPIANLSGTYTKTINGVGAGQVVLMYNRDTRGFVMCSTKSNELDLLRDRLDALTGG